MKDNFEQSVDTLVLAEGGYSHDAFDFGGETYMGISRRFHPGWGGWILIDSFKLDGRNFFDCLRSCLELDQLVRDFYRAEYWDLLNLDEVPLHVDYELFEMAVNQGVEYAVKCMQRACNALNYDRHSKDLRLFPDLAEDGKYGDKTRQAMAVIIRSGWGAPFVETVNILQGVKYVDGACKTVSQRKFFKGWLTRVAL